MATIHPTSRRILVAGATGVIGRRLCRLLVNDGWRVTGTTRSPDKAADLRAMGVEPAVVDVYDEDTLRRLAMDTRPEVVIHQLTDLPPGLDPAKMGEARQRTARIRDVGTRNLLAAAVGAGVRRFVAQSIGFAYAPGPIPYSEDAPLNVDADGDAGLTARAVASLERQVAEAPLEGLVLRYGKLYGPGTGFDRPPTGGPLHVDAAADAARRAAMRGTPGVYNLAEPDGMLVITRATAEFAWSPNFRIDSQP